MENKNTFSISVVIPMYNSEKTILKALLSVVNQTYLPAEIIIVNDGSTDNSQKIVEEFIINNNKQYSFLLLNKSNGGVSSARNIGIKRATGEYIAFLDSDDRWLPEKLQKQMMFFRDNEDIDLLATNRNNEIVDSFMGIKFSTLTKISSKLLLFKNFLSPPTVVMKKSIVNEIGYFDENQRYAEEGDFWIRVCKDNNCYLLNESLAITGDGKPYFGHSGLSSNLLGMERGELKNLKTAYKLKIINFFEYLFLNIFSILKYFRRVLIVKFNQ